MENIEPSGFKEFFEKIKDYIQTRVELTKLTIIESIVLGVGSLVAGGVLLILGLIFLLFISLALGFYLSAVIGNTYAGFFIVSGFYLLLMIIVYLMKENYIVNPLVNTFIKKIFKDKEEGGKDVS